MAIHRRRESARPGARMLLESNDPVSLPPAEINIEGVSVEREEFRQYVNELLEILSAGVEAMPAPVVMSNSIFVIEGATRSFWVRLWHLDAERTQIDRLHLSSCPPRVPGLRLPDFSSK